MLLNRERATSVMEKYALDGLIAAFPENIYYLSDYWGTMFLMSRNYSFTPSCRGMKTLPPR